MTIKLNNLLTSLEKAELKVEKTTATIERHFKQLEKKVAVLTKLGYELDYSEVQFKNVGYSEFKKQIAHIENQKWNSETGKSVNEYYELCDVCGKLEDIQGAYRKLEEASKIVSNWKVKVVSEKAKVDFATSAPKVIIDFVNSWGELAFEWLMENTERPNESSIRTLIENDKQIKIIQLTMRVTDVVGTITDARNLSVGEKGDLTGIIVGEEGKARLETISAGGWNIQCYHYRTLVTAL